MSFIEKTTQFITGKSKSEREADRLATSIARRQIQKAELEERSVQGVRLAREKVKLATEAKLRRMKEQYNRPAGSFFGGIAAAQPKKYSPPFGGGVADVIGGFGGGNPMQSKMRKKKVKQFSVI